MHFLRRSKSHLLINLFLSALILHQGLSFTLLNPDLRSNLTNETFESYFIEFVEWISGKDIDITSVNGSLSEPEPGAEEEISESETKKINNLTDHYRFYAIRKLWMLAIQDENWIPAAFIELFTPPPELS